MDTVQRAAQCTGLVARWCPIHGDCTCPDDVRQMLDDPDCPLHAPASPHPEPPPETVREHYASLEQLAPGDRIWLDGAWREVTGTEEDGGDVAVFTGTFRAGDARDFTAPAALLVRRAER